MRHRNVKVPSEQDHFECNGFQSPFGLCNGVARKIAIPDEEAQLSLDQLNTVGTTPIHSPEGVGELVNHLLRGRSPGTTEAPLAAPWVNCTGGLSKRFFKIKKVQQLPVRLVC
ncbi:hypothetical protein Tco_1504658 [Tanacetum coccineum]